MFTLYMYIHVSLSLSFLSPLSCSILQHRVKVTVSVILLVLFIASHYFDGPHKQVSHHTSGRERGDGVHNDVY